jgi:glycosyltransferase involved in cell wall biosynthesis
MPHPLVSTLIDTFNQERYIEQAILSVLEQGLSTSELEVIVVDDGSTDGTGAIVQKFLPRVRYIRKENGGQASAFNLAIPEAHGQIVSFLDGDDWWVRGKLRAVLDAMETAEQVAAVGHGYFEVTGTGEVNEMVVPERTLKLDLLTPEAARFADNGRTLLGTSRLSVRRNILSRIMPIPEVLTFCADTPIFTLALALGGAVVLDDPLCYYRLHGDNLFSSDTQDKSRLRKLLEVYGFLLNYLPEQLIKFGVPKEAIAALLTSDRIELERCRIRFEGNGRWRALRTELQRFLWTYENPGPGYVVFKTAVALLALLLPPRFFYRLMAWYGQKDLKRIRAVLGRAQPRVPIEFVQRRPAVGRRSVAR